MSLKSKFPNPTFVDLCLCIIEYGHIKIHRTNDDTDKGNGRLLEKS